MHTAIGAADALFTIIGFFTMLFVGAFVVTAGVKLALKL